jgi:hypothetical protein
MNKNLLKRVFCMYLMSITSQYIESMESRKEIQEREKKEKQLKELKNFDITLQEFNSQIEKLEEDISRINENNLGLEKKLTNLEKEKNFSQDLNKKKEHVKTAKAFNENIRILEEKKEELILIMYNREILLMHEKQKKEKIHLIETLEIGTTNLKALGIDINTTSPSALEEKKRKINTQIEEIEKVDDSLLSSQTSHLLKTFWGLVITKQPETLNDDKKEEINQLKKQKKLIDMQLKTLALLHKNEKDQNKEYNISYLEACINLTEQDMRQSLQNKQLDKFNNQKQTRDDLRSVLEKTQKKKIELEEEKIQLEKQCEALEKNLKIEIKNKQSYKEALNQQQLYAPDKTDQIVSKKIYKTMENRTKAIDDAERLLTNCRVKILNITKDLDFINSKS